MESLIRDLRHAARTLMKQRATTVATVITLALGLGATTAVFSVLDAVVLSSLPYRQSERLGIVWVDFGDDGQSLPAISAADFRDMREMGRTFEALAAGTGRTANLTGEGDPEQVDLGEVTHDFFAVLGTPPARGRGFLPAEDVANGPAVIVLSHGLWQRRFGGDPDVVGRTVQLDGIDHRVLGVMPAGFELLLPKEGVFLRDSDVWTPLQETYDGPRNRTLLTAFVRLRKEVTFEQAQLEMDSIASRLKEAHQVHQLSDTRIRVVPLHHDVVKNIRPPLFALFVAAVLVLLIACGNVAGLLASRATARRQEIAIRTALGAGRARIVRGLLIENGLLASAGGAAGVLLAGWGAAALRFYGPSDLPRVGSVALDRPVLAFAAAACFATILLFGVVPAARTARLGAWSATAGVGRATTPGRQLLRPGMVIGQVALSLVLLIGVGLLMRSFVLLQDADPGFKSHGALAFRLSLPASRYARAERVLFFERLEDELRGLPGVRSVGAVSQLPLGGGASQMPYAYDDETALNWESVTADARVVTPELFGALGFRLAAGRPFDQRDRDEGLLVAIVDEVLAAKAWPGGDPVGQRVQLPVFGPEGLTREWHEVIGMVEHVRLHDLSRDVREQIYLPHAQSFNRSMDVVVAGTGDLATLAAQIPPAVHGLDPDLPVHALRRIDEYVFAALAQRRFILTLAGVFAAIALLLAAVGLYGVVSYAVGARTREFGIRLAFGARQGGIFRLVVVQGLRLVAIGVAVGLAAAAASGSALSGLLYGVSAVDPLAFLVGALVLTAVALVACYLPARRATRVDPVIALRQD